MPKSVKVKNKQQSKGKGPAANTKKAGKPKPKPNPANKPNSTPKPLSESTKPTRKPDQPKKLKLRDQKYIPIPESAFLSSKSQGKKRARDDDGDEEGTGNDLDGEGSGSGSGSEADSEELDHGMIIDGEEDEAVEYMQGGGASFLTGLDPKVLSRTAKESQRLHLLDKQRNPVPEPSKKSKHAPLDEDDEDLETLSGSDLDDLDSEDLEDLGSDEMEDMDDEEVEVLKKGKAKQNGKGEDYPVEEEGYSSTDDEDDEDDDLASDSDLSISDASSLPSASDDNDEDARPLRKRVKREGEDGLEDRYLTSAGNKRRKLAAAQNGDGDEEKEHTEVGHLPIKLANGEIQKVEGTTRIALPPPKKPAQQPKRPSSSDTDFTDSASDANSSDEEEKVDRLASTKGKFGRMGIVDILVKDLDGLKGREKSGVRLGMAKEQIARIGAEITGGGELIDLIPLLTRLSTFGLAKVKSMDENNSVLEVPNSIRGLAFLSQLAVYKDLIPGYRIRELTALEESEKVRDEVRRLREGEKGLVKSYKGYLKNLEAEVKGRTPLASVSLKCMCDLLTSAPHFNFAENLMGVIVGRLSKRSWDNDSEHILQTIITVFRNDTTSQQSAVLLRLIARMIKERHYNVNPNVMRCLLHLRLRSELGHMREKGKGRGDGPNAKERAEIKAKSETRKKWMNKNRRKAEEERKEIEKELNEASAEVDKEERAIIQTETLKNLFVLYFSIIKQPKKSPMLGAAMEGISKYAHLVNIEFFRDLLAVLKTLVKAEAVADAEDEEEDAAAPDVVGTGASVRLRMLGIVTAFELLSGQGEALNLDLNEFITQLYALLQPLSLDTNIESAPKQPKSGKDDNKAKFDPTARIKKVPTDLATTADLMFRCLHLIFFSRHVHSSNSPPWRAAAFGKRLLECSLQFPPATAMKAVQFVQQLVAREPKLEAFLSSDDRTADGVYRPDLNDPQLANSFATSFWELAALERDHWDPEIRERAGLLANGHLL